MITGRAGNPHRPRLLPFLLVHAAVIKQQFAHVDLQIRQDGHMGGSVSSSRVLFVDDDTDVRVSTERGLRLSGFDVATAGGSTDALRAVRETGPDAVVMNIGVPVLACVRTLAAIRGIDRDVPVCVLSAPCSVNDRFAGLEAGADDYLVKPFGLDQLVGRVRALLRSRGTDARLSPSIQIGPLVLDIASRRVRMGNTEVVLTRREFDLLEKLAEHESTVLSRSQLLKMVWGYDFAAQTDVVDVFIGYLRRKLEADGAPRLVHTISGAGFRLGASV